MTDIAATEIVTGEIVPTDLSALEEIRSRDFTTGQVIEALTALALNGGSPAGTARMLKERGLDVGRGSLVRWRDRYPNRYQRLQRDLVPRIEDGLVPIYRDVAMSGAEGRTKLSNSSGNG